MGGGKRSKNKKGNNKGKVQAVGNITFKEVHKKGKGESSKQDSKTIDESVESVKIEGSTNAAASLNDEKQQTISRRQKKNRSKKTAGVTEEKGAAQEQANVPDRSVLQYSTNADFKDESTNEDIPSSHETSDVKIETHDDNNKVPNWPDESLQSFDSNTEAEHSKSHSNLEVNTTTDDTDSDWNISESKMKHVSTNPYEANSARNSSNPYGANEYRRQTPKVKSEWNQGSPMENRRNQGQSSSDHWNNKGSSRNNDRSGDYHSGNSSRSYGESSQSERSGNRNYGRGSDNFDNKRNNNYNSRRSDTQVSYNKNENRGSQFQDDFDDSKRTYDAGSKRSRSHNRENYDNFGPNTNRNSQTSSGDKEFDEFRRISKKYYGDSFVKVKEIHEDLFKMPEEYALAHCVAEDMSMGSGIAVQFSQQFKSRDELYQQKQKQGGLAVLSVGKGRFIYYLVTKKLSNGKPTMYTMWCSLRKLQQHMEENKVQKLAIPRIGCGLDRLEWSDVKAMIEYVFRDTDVNITVCNFQQPEGEAATSPPKSRKCPVKNVSYSLADIEGGTAIIYLGTEDGHVSEEIENLDKKFNFIKDYKIERKQVGKVLQMYKQNKNYCLYGFIIAKSKHDAFSFVDFQKCVLELRKLNKDFYYVAIEAFLNEDELIMSKIVNLLRCSLFDVEVYVCWPGRMQTFMPMERRDDRFSF